MKLGIQPTSAINEEEKRDSLFGYIRDLITKLRTVIDNGRLGFGDGVVQDNIAGVWVTYTTHATPNTEVAVTHNLGVIPVGYIVMAQSAAGILYSGGTSWTISQIFLKCTVASVTVKIFILSPSNQTA